MTNRMRLGTLSSCLFAILQTSVGVGAQETSLAERYDKRETMVAMRDGTQLFTQVYTPKDRSRPHPVMLFRTPYGIGDYGPTVRRSVLGPSKLFSDAGYVFVYQDVRGKFQSEGTFVVMQPVASRLDGPEHVDETTDTWDTVQWIVENVEGHNGRVGMWGISYPGWQTVMGMIDAHPALKAVSPQASPADMYIGDDFHHNGAFRLMYTFHWLSGNASTREGRSTQRSARFDYGTNDGYRFFLDLGPVRNVDARYFHERVPTWNEYMEHGTYDAYWQRQAVLQHLGDVRPAVLHVAGWFDAEDFYGPMEIYRATERGRTPNESSLVVGPWRHGGWARETGESLGEIPFGSQTAHFYQENVEFPFFEHHLRDGADPNLPEALVFETGSNVWRRYAQWPPQAATTRRLYLHARGRASFEKPTQPGGADEFASDPANPVPWSAEKRTTQGHTWMIEDQRFCDGRDDVLVYRTDPLPRDVVIAGPILAKLQTSTTGKDADWIVKLIDEYPAETTERSAMSGESLAGFQMLLAGEVMRAKFRNSFQSPEPVVPGEITPIAFDLRDRYHRFRKGHRIMVQIQSSWFPVIDRNPQTFCDIYHVGEDAFQTATHRVHRSRHAASHLELLTLPAGS
ncbi:MAG: CocE/NonD family hydrolase [Planctomycetes bacterium]|nr:CocE/NonD family hydrolase [Planctomycetota bacterium]